MEWKNIIEMGIFFAALLAVLIPIQIFQSSRTDRLYEMFVDLVNHSPRVEKKLRVVSKKKKK